jgi:hypothetical protein
LFESKLVPEPLTHQDDWRLPDWGIGLTNIVQRPKDVKKGAITMGGQIQM